MIQTSLVEKNGTRSLITEVRCDYCGSGTRWGPGALRVIPRGDRAKHILRKEGWKLGKEHLCPKCLSSKQQPRQAPAASARQTPAVPDLRKSLNDYGKNW